MFLNLNTFSTYRVDQNNFNLAGKDKLKSQEKQGTGQSRNLSYQGVDGVTDS